MKRRLRKKRKSNILRKKMARHEDRKHETMNDDPLFYLLIML